MILLKIAWKNIWRKKVRTAVIIMAVFIGLTGGLLGSAFAFGYTGQMVRAVIEQETAHIIAQPDSFSINWDIYFYLEENAPLFETLSNMEEVKAISPRLRIIANLATAGTSFGVSLIGVEPDYEKEIFVIHDLIPDSCGSYFNEPIRNPIVIGKSLAAQLGVGIGSRLVTTFQSTNGQFVSSVFRVAGIYQSENRLSEQTTVFVLNYELERLSGVPAGSAHEIALKFNAPLEKLPEIRNHLASIHPEVSFFLWSDLRPEIGLLHAYIGLMTSIVIGIILLALSFGIVNTMLMVVLERTQETGMLRAIGMSDKRVFLMVAIETLLLILTGTILSLIFSYFLIKWTEINGIDLSFATKSDVTTHSWISIVYPYLGLQHYIIVAVMVFFTGILSAIYPALKVLKLSPVEAIRKTG